MRSSILSELSFKEDKEYTLGIWGSGSKEPLNVENEKTANTNKTESDQIKKSNIPSKEESNTNTNKDVDSNNNNNNFKKDAHKQDPDCKIDIGINSFKHSLINSRISCSGDGNRIKRQKSLDLEKKSDLFIKAKQELSKSNYSNIHLPILQISKPPICVSMNNPGYK